MIYKQHTDNDKCARKIINNLELILNISLLKRKTELHALINELYVYNHASLNVKLLTSTMKLSFVNY